MPVVCACGREAGAGEIDCSLCGRELIAPSPVPPDAWSSETAPAPYPVPPLPPAPAPHAWPWESPPVPPPPPSVRRDPALILIGVLVLALVVAALLFFMNRPVRAADPPVPAEQTAAGTPRPVDSYSPPPTASEYPDPSETPTTVVYPDVTISGLECGREGDGPYAAAASGNINTTCPFALNVGEEYRERGANGDPVTLYVYSPSTGDWYYLDCSGDQPVTCVNTTKAVVYLYGGHANFSE